jgi:uncharacterized membrane protein YphA (DoxX/SURF4 family)
MTQTASPIARVISHLCALAVAGFFLYFASSKILGLGPLQFTVDINNFKILPREAVNLAAILMPWWEVAAALALIIPRTRRSGAILIAGMLVMFIVAVAIAMAKGLDISCGCAGKGSGKAGWTTIGRNVLLLAGTGLSVWAQGLWSMVQGRLRSDGFPVGAVPATAEETA